MGFCKNIALVGFGAAIGAGYVGKKVLESKMFKDYLKKCIHKAVDILLYGDDIRPIKRTDYTKEPYNNFYFRNRDDAEMVADVMDDYIDKYGAVTVADFYEFIGEKSKRFSDNNYGWTNHLDIRVMKAKNGEYTINLPKAKPLD